MNPTDVLFNDVPLSNLMEVENLVLNNYPDYEIRQYKVARANKSIVTSKEAVSKNLSVIGQICKSTRAETESFVALLKLAVFGINGVLMVRQAGFDVSYNATCTEVNLNWDGSLVLVTLNFLASNPFGKVEPAQVVNFPSITSANQSFTLAATSTTQINPVITLSYTGITGGTGGSVTIRNAETLSGITITNDFATNDVLYIDSENMIVTLNDIPVDFSGTFPIFVPNIASIFVPQVNIDYLDTFTTRTAGGTFLYNVGV